MAVDVSRQTYDVGGVLLDRPFKLRRLGHFGYNSANADTCLPFYRDLLGFRLSDELRRTPDGPPFGYFMRYGGDHHAFVLMREALDARGSDVTTNQITWQLGSLKEVTDASSWLEARGVKMQRTGRDMPGSNWHTYFYDPDGHTNELYYGMEQIGWNGESKPTPMYSRRFREPPTLPQMAEGDEIEQALAENVDVHSGYRAVERGGSYEVDGVLLRRPFKIVRIGPVRLFVKDMASAEAFYRETLGFAKSEEITWQGHRCVFLRANTEHHSLALYPVALRGELGLRADSSCMSFGVQLGTYRQLRDAVTFFREHDCRIRELPPELFPGMGHSAFVFDPDGHAVQLYAYMEQIGWDGTPRPPQLRPQIKQGEWPEVLAGQPDSYSGEVFLGPWG